jgi:Family of unknown function (DUF6069)
MPVAVQRPHPGAAPGRRVGRCVHSGYAIAAAAAALAATAIMHLLLVATPRPQLFFAWIIGLATVIAVVYPFSTTAPLSQKVATAVVNLVLGAGSRAGRHGRQSRSPAWAVGWGR